MYYNNSYMCMYINTQGSVSLIYTYIYKYIYPSWSWATCYGFFSVCAAFFFSSILPWHPGNYCFYFLNLIRLKKSCDCFHNSKMCFFSSYWNMVVYLIWLEGHFRLLVQKLVAASVRRDGEVLLHQPAMLAGLHDQLQCRFLSVCNGT